jgi:methylglyoxal synthase
MIPNVILTTTSFFREIHLKEFQNFLEKNFLWLIKNVNLWITGTTYETIISIMKNINKFSLIEEDLKQIKKLPPQSIGMVSATFELIEGRIQAVFHLSHYKDIHHTFAASALKRQSLVHNIIYADTIQAASNIINYWEKEGFHSIILKMNSIVINLNLLENKNNLALIAHDGKKLDICLLVIEYLHIILSFDYIIATGTTGGWIKKFITAACKQKNIIDKNNIERIEKKFVLCESGPKGGDVQIAHIALKGLCSNIIFLIDPMTAHPHEPDIRFLEQMVESSCDYPVKLATNIESAKYLLLQQENK